MYCIFSKTGTCSPKELLNSTVFKESVNKFRASVSIVISG